MKSTGPQTQEGKERSRANARKHGLCAETLYIEGDLPFRYCGLDLQEDPEAAADEMLAAMFQGLDPQGELECFYAAEVVGHMWRIRRIKAMETAILRRPLLVQNEEGEDELDPGIAYPEIWNGNIALLSLYEQRLQKGLRYYEGKLRELQEERCELELFEEAHRRACETNPLNLDRTSPAQSDPSDTSDQSDKSDKSDQSDPSDPSDTQEKTNEPIELEMDPQAAGRAIEEAVSREMDRLYYNKGGSEQQGG